MATLPPPATVLDLVERFERNRDEYMSGKYNEAQVRSEFLAPFFEYLGWDVNNRQGYAEAYKDVIHEDSLEIGGGTKAPDYCFRVGGTRKFFVEAKKPSVHIATDRIECRNAAIASTDTPTRTTNNRRHGVWLEIGPSVHWSRRD
jgi:predicted type IV restriction endonuclease